MLSLPFHCFFLSVSTLCQLAAVKISVEIFPLKNNSSLPQGSLGVSGLIQGDLVQTPLTGSNSIQGTLTVGPHLWILSSPGDQRCSLVEGRAVGYRHPSGRSRHWRMMMEPKDPGMRFTFNILKVNFKKKVFWMHNKYGQ